MNSINITSNPWLVCIEVQKYLKDKYSIDFVTSRKKIFPLAQKLKGKYKYPDIVSCEEFAEDLYKLYVSSK